MVKYLVVGDWVSSKNDRNLHYVNADRLINLYGVDPSECKKIESNRPESLLGIDFSKLIVLPVLYHGKYREHLEKIKEGLKNGI